MKSIRFLTLAALFATAFPSVASQYYVVVPVPNKTVSTEAIQVALGGFTLPSGTLGSPYAGFDFKTLLSVTGDPAYTGYGVKWSLVSGSLPAGLSFNADGTVSGTPTAPGTASFQIQASYKTKSGQQSYQIVVAQLTVGLAAGAPTAALVGVPYAYDLKPLLSIGGDPAYVANTGVTWTYSASSLPAGLYLNVAGMLVGTPTEAGTGSITVKATYKGVDGQQAYQIITQPVTVSLADVALPDATQGVAYVGFDFHALASSNDPSFHADQTAWTGVGLPAGLTLNSAGVLSGTPAVSGVLPLTVRASYKAATGERTYTLKTTPSVLVTASSSSLDFGSVPDYSAAKQTLTLTNAGGTAGALTLTSTSSNFSVSGCSTIPANGTCQATVTFYPTGLANYSGQLNITGMLDGPLTVPMTGVGALNVQTFTASTSWQVPAKLTWVKLLMVGGGGGPAAASGPGGTGGGGGRVVYNAHYPVTPGASIPVVVGAGGGLGGAGDGLENGQPSQFDVMVAQGGLSGYNGGVSGNGHESGGAIVGFAAAGGGGSGTVGLPATDNLGGAGGDGQCSSLTGTQLCLGGGGGGGVGIAGATPAAGGIGGGGIGGTLSVPGGAGVPNTGGGAGGGGGAGRNIGGSGVVIVVY